ncbi:MAG: DUF6939 family protein [Actinomadura sp.]
MRQSTATSSRPCGSAYRWTLHHRTTDLTQQLREPADTTDVVLLDYTTNGDITDPTSPLSHAALIRLHLENRWPQKQ